MATNYIVLNSKFKPFSYAELLQPVEAATQAHRDYEAKLAELGITAGTIGKLLDPNKEQGSYNMYNSFMQELEDSADSLSKEGLGKHKDSLMNLWRRYATDIKPIETMYNKREQLINEQRQLNAQDDSIRFNNDFSKIGLDDMLNGSKITYTPVSGNKLTQTVANVAQNLARQVRNDPTKWNNILGGQYFQSETIRGYTDNEIFNTIMNTSEGIPLLRKIVEDAVYDTGIQNWENYDELKDWAFDYGNRGLYYAIGDRQSRELSNKAFDYAMQEKMQINKEEREIARKKAEEANRLYFRPVPKTTVDGDKNTRQMNEDLKLIQEIISNPALLDKKDTRIVRDPKYISPDPMMSFVMDSGLGESRQETYYPYQEKLKELSKRYGVIKYTITDGKLSGGNLAELAQKLERDIRSSAVRAFSFKPNITSSEKMAQVIKENVRSYERRSKTTGLYEIKNNKKGDAVDIDNINDYITPNNDVDIDFDPDLGFIINSTDSKGKTRSAIIDTELLDDPNRTFSKAQSSIKTALDYGEDELAMKYIEALMKVFHDKFDTLEEI